MTCPHCGESSRIGVHVEQKRRLICHACRRTFTETKGTAFFGLHYPIWMVVLVSVFQDLGATTKSPSPIGRGGDKRLPRPLGGS